MKHLDLNEKELIQKTDKTPNYWVWVKDGEKYIRVFAYWLSSEYWRHSTQADPIESYKEDTNTYILYTTNKNPIKGTHMQTKSWKFIAKIKYEVTYK